MPKTLILAEKPSQARDYAKGLGDFARRDGYLENEHYLITWAIGHLVELREPHEYDPALKKWSASALPILPDPFRYRPTEAGAKQFKVIRSLLQERSVEKVVIATDAGREGELIARLILGLARNHKPVWRFWSSKALSPEEVRLGMAGLRPAGDFDRLYRSALCRQQADWLIGINATRAYTLRAGGDLHSLGRVQTPVLAMIVARQGEIDRFVPEDYWTLRATFAAAAGSYKGQWIGTDDEQREENKEGARIPSEARAREIADRVEAAGSGEVAEVRRQAKKEPPPLLFSLTSLQIEANRKFGLAADQTLRLAQSLYEENKALSYPRTESQHLGEAQAKEVPAILDQLAQQKTVLFSRAACTVNPRNRRIFNDAKLTDHHALMPTGQILGILSAEQRKVFELVVRRFIAAFYPDHVYEATRILTVAGGERFRSNGRVTVTLGWKEVYGAVDDKEEKDPSLPALTQGESVCVEETAVEQKQTRPPAPYSDATLLKDMENARKFVTEERLRKILKETAGLGTAATRAEVLKTLERRDYIRRQGKNLIPLPKGIALIEAVTGERIADPAYTALWEQQLDEIARGAGVTPDAFLEKVRDYTRAIVAKAAGSPPLKPSGAHRKPVGEVVGTCPDCGREVFDRPKSYGCSGYPECKFALWKDGLSRLGKKEITLHQAKGLLAGKAIPLKGLKGKSGKKFEARGKLSKHERFGWQVELKMESQER
jgi:DNA topoisomerase III